MTVPNHRSEGPSERLPPSSSPPLSRAVRVERWSARTFYAIPCKFLIDVPIDLSGCVIAGAREARRAGYRLLPTGDAYATDAIYRGALLLEVDPESQGVEQRVVLDVEVLARELPESVVRLRAELGELVRWSVELGYEVTGRYVRYDGVGTSPTTLRPRTVFAAIRGADPITEPPPPSRANGGG